MLSQRLYFLSLEIFLESTINHQKLDEARSYVQNICEEYDKQSKSTLFSELVEEKSKFYKTQLLNEDETLFIQDTHIPYLIKSKELITEKDKLLVYAIIQYWVLKYKIPNNFIYQKLASAFYIEPIISAEIDSFFSDKEILKKSRNYICINPKKGDEIENLEGEWVDGNKPEKLISEEQIVSAKISSNLHVLYLNKERFMLLMFEDKNTIFSKNDQRQLEGCCLLESGDTITTLQKGKISYAELKKKLVEKHYSKNFYLSALRVEIKYSNKKGIRPFNFIGQPGELIGIVGREGSGKSTLLRLLAGVEVPKSGSIYINGYDLHKNPYQLNGFIGYVPEEDLLYPELTAYENLYIAAQLYLRNSDSTYTKTLVENILIETELWDIKDTLVGKPSDKFIQPGQRRLLNIGLELIRDPQILVVDNSPSSLSMSDSSKVIEVLNKYTFKGKLIITSITQSCSSSFEYFDNLFILEHGGIPVYYGPRYNALHYLLCFLPSGITQEYIEQESYSPETLLNLLTKKVETTAREKSSERYIDPNKLYENFIDQPQKLIDKSRKRKKTPGQQIHVPKLEKQFLIYFLRNFKTKIARRRDLTFTIFSAPFIAFILAIILRNSDGAEYSFGRNPNIPAFFYISIIVNVFLGLTQSIREILREKYVLKKEEGLNLSLFSYINSKVAYLFIILTIQSFLFTLIANPILEINGMFFYHWLIYFTCGAGGVLLGLVFSLTHHLFESIVLKSIPITFILILILGGGWIPLKDLNFTKDRYTPFLSDLTISRWAYEAIMVQQYAGNPYERNFFSVDRQISSGSFNSYHMLPALRNDLEAITEYDFEKGDEKAIDSLNIMLSALKNRFTFYSVTEDIFPFEYNDSLDIIRFDSEIANEAMEYISYLDYYFYNNYNQSLRKKNAITDSLSNVLGVSGLEQLRETHVNIYISELVRNTAHRSGLKLIGEHWIQLSNPIYQTPENNIGRTAMFLPEKRFNSQIIKTFEFNLSVLWLFNFLFYILLITNLIKRISKILRPY